MGVTLQEGILVLLHYFRPQILLTIMVNFDIDEIKEAIAGMPNEKKLEYLSDKENEIYGAIEEMNTLLADIKELRDEMEDESQKLIRDKILQAINDAGYIIPLDKDGNLSFAFEEATLTIFMCFSNKIDFNFKVDSNQLTYRKMISTLVPDYKQDGNLFYKPVSEETLCEEIISLVKRLKNSMVDKDTRSIIRLVSSRKRSVGEELQINTQY